MWDRLDMLATLDEPTGIDPSRADRFAPPVIDDRHPEFAGTESYFVPTELPRTFFARLTYRF